MTSEHERQRKALYRKKNPEKYRAAMRARGKLVRRRFRKIIEQYKLGHPCVDCGEADPIVLEFDHRNPLDKLFNIAALPSVSMSGFLAEIAKCDIRCANCHRRKTYPRNDNHHGHFHG